MSSIANERNVLKLYWKLFFLFAIVFVSSRIRASEPLTWVYGHFPPYIYIEENGQPYGIHAELLKNILKHADIEYQAVFAPNRRARKMMSDGSAQLAMGPLDALKNPDDFHISRIIVVKIDLRTYWIGDQKPVTQSSDLNGESVVLITSFDYSGLRNYAQNPDNKVTVAVRVENHKRALLALSRGRATYMLGYRQPVELMQLEMNIQNLNSYPMLQTNNYLFINKSVKNSRKMMDKLEASFLALYPKDLDGISGD
jgi:polar amino acid transport system substrate-binding protein